MQKSPSDIVFTLAVQAIQNQQASRNSNAWIGLGHAGQTSVYPDMTECTAVLNRVVLGAALADGQPHIPFHSGPSGFLKVLVDETQKLADFARNKQNVTLGCQSALLKVISSSGTNVNRHWMKLECD